MMQLQNPLNSLARPLSVSRQSASLRISHPKTFAAPKNGAPAGTSAKAPAGSVNPAAGETVAPGLGFNDALTTKPVLS